MAVAIAMNMTTRHEQDDGEVEIESVADFIPFLDFATMLEKVSTAKKDEKVIRIKKYFQLFRNTFLELHGTLDSTAAAPHGDSIFSIVRLLCPTWDRGRSSYGIKDVVMGRVFAKIHKIDKHDSDGKQLYNYKNPSIVGKVAAGDVASVIYNVLRSRSTHSDSSKSPKINELHTVLDQLAKNKGDEESKVTQDTQITILQGFAQRLSALEGKWLAKIILKKMDLGVNESTILGLVHLQAKDLLDTLSLHRVCQICNNPDAVDVPTGKVYIFSYFKPMLCNRLDLRDGDAMDAENGGKVIISRSKKNPTTLPPAPFLVETKFDGERFQIHFQRSSNGTPSCFKYFSRSGFEYKEFNATLTPRLQKLIYPVIDSFVMDGEMMAYNYRNKSFTAKGKSMDVKTILETDSVHCPAFVAWDLVFLNGASLCDKPLFERMELLQKVIQPKESVCYISEQVRCESLGGVIQLLDKAVENCEEGIVIKHQHSVYEAGQRKPTWLKLKPEYVAGYRVNDLDLLVVGGFYADKARRGGSITSLLLGLIDGSDVYPVSKVGCGRLKHHELAELVKSLEPYFVTQEVSCVKFKGKRPDVFIEPKNSVVLEVNASEINRSKDHLLNYALRFPVISRVRRDKPWYDAMTVEDFHKLRESCKQGKMVAPPKRPADPGASGQPLSKFRKGYWGSPIKFNVSSDEETGTHAYRQKPTNSTKLVAKKVKTKQTYVSPSKINEIRAIAIAESNRLDSPQTVSTLFQGKVFYLMGSSTWQNDIKQKLSRNGAEIVKNPTWDTFAIVAEKETELVKHKMALGKWEILNGTTWIEKCITTSSIQPFVPLDLFFAREETRESFRTDFDVYGDSFTKEVSSLEVKTIVEKVIQDFCRSQESMEDLSEIKESLYREFCLNDKTFAKWSLFKKCKVAFLPRVDAELKMTLEFYGGKVVDDCFSPEVTHIILLDGQNVLSFGDVPTTVPCLQAEWIQACVKKKKLISVVPYKL